MTPTKIIEPNDDNDKEEVKEEEKSEDIHNAIEPQDDEEGRREK